MAHDATLHPSTVTDISKGKTLKVKRSSKTRQKAAPVISLKVVPMVWKKAMELAKGDPRVLEVLNEETVIVHNHANWKEWR